MVELKDICVITALAVFSPFFATAYRRYATEFAHRDALRGSSWFTTEKLSLLYRSRFRLKVDEPSQKNHFIICASNSDHLSFTNEDDDAFLDGLNEIQRQIVTADLMNTRVQAGPGSGKTR